LKGERVLVTGGAGFIGSHLAEHLSRENDVVVLDDLSTGSEANVKGFVEDVTFVRGSILDVDVLEDAMDSVAYVFHQAALPSIQRSIKEPERVLAVNTAGTLRVLEAARHAGVRKVVYASSSSVYGDTPTLPKREDMPISPISPYGASKAAAEAYCEAYRGSMGLPTVSLRYFNVFGPRQDPESEYAAVIPKFIRLLQKGERPVIYGDGKQSRDFTYVENVVRGNVLAAESETEGIYNLACGERHDLHTLLEVLGELSGNPAEPVYEDPQPGDIRHSQADIARARRDFGYEVAVDLREGLRRTWEHAGVGR
jgi:UDP-glucose 4-epimerase